jgi:GT2 family glycosyltransferase
VIVPVRDDASHLSELIDLLAAQTLARASFEVIIGDDGSSTPPTTLEDAHPRVVVTSGPPQTSYAARNRAVARSAAPVLAFCDADCRPEPAWLKTGLEALHSADVAAGAIRFLPPNRSTVWALLDMDTFLDQERAVRAGRAVTANLLVRREMFERVGGFDGTLANNGDFDFVRRAVRAGARICFVPDAVVWHPVREDARAFLRKVWAVNARYAVRESRARRRPEGLRLRSWVPVVQPLRARRRAGKPIGLDASRVTTTTTQADWWANLRTLPFMYLVLPYVANVAQLAGWRRGRALR